MSELSQLDKNTLAKLIDFSILPKETRQSEILEGCRLMREYDFAAFYTSSSFWTPIVQAELADMTNIEIGTGIAFPFGSVTPRLKAAEVEEAVKRGCTTVDMVMNVGALRSGDLKTVRDELRLFVDAAGDAVTKYILEVCYLTDKEIRIACQEAIEVGVDFVKTSTGQFEGPMLEQFLVMRREVENTPVRLKVAGVKCPRPQNAMVFILAGAHRVGTRAAIEIVDALDTLKEVGLCR